MQGRPGHLLVIVRWAELESEGEEVREEPQ
jgi:hypothetical protein